MFTGIIEEIADIQHHSTDKDITTFTITRPKGWELHLGQSIAVNGVCLTVTAFASDSFEVELMPETMKKTVFGRDIPSRVNLERAMSPESLFEGHIVQGHVDALSRIVDIDESPQWRTIKVAYPPDKAGLLVEKGSVSIDGTSLTIVEVTEDTFSVSLIPHTLEHTTLGSKKLGDYVNIEYDIIGKFIERQLKQRG